MEELLCINNTCTDPYFNLAVEEYLLKNRTENVFMLWQNEPVVVVGKHQNIQVEINHDFIEEKGIKVARRLSGGGTVYHDLGNLNFTYIMNGEDGKLVDFKKYTDDILKVLNSLGAHAERNERNDILINSKKISGNAEHIFKRRVIHHGTLLFDSDLEVLNDAISIKENNYTDKAVQSVRSKVTNILPYLNYQMTIDGFKTNLIDFVLKKYSNSRLYDLNSDEKEKINELKAERYSKWDWIYGYSPKYSLKKVINKKQGSLEIELLIKKGIIAEVKLSGELLSSKEKAVVYGILSGQRHDRNHLNKIFAENTDIERVNSVLRSELIRNLF